jgi:glucose/arabinose dehydrogenase
MRSIRFFAPFLTLSLIFVSTSRAASPVCDTDNGGIKLPAGFCAQVVADGLGAARQAVVGPNGDLYVALMSSRNSKGGVVGLRDADGDGKLEVTERFGDLSSTGIAIRTGYLYVATVNAVIRYKMTPGQLKPSGDAEIVVGDLPDVRQHGDKGLAFDGKGSLYVNIGSPSNACQQPDRRLHVGRQDPCPLLEKHGGIWKFDENKLGQKQEDGVLWATGLRQEPAITWHEGKLYIVMNSRDSLDQFWPEKFTAQDNAERPAEPMYRVDKQGENFGWPYCFFDYPAQRILLNPEYGSDGKEVGRCAGMSLPIASYPAHWAPVDVKFYGGSQFPPKYKGGAFIAFHGSWNRQPAQDGYNVTFQPFSGEKPAGKFEIFASGFPGKDPLTNPNDAAARADGVAEAPDGSLYITDSQKGKIWRVFYKGSK